MLKRSFLILSACALAWAAQASAATVNVSTEAALQNAVANANSSGGNVTILIADGTYNLTRTVNVTAPNVTLAGASGTRERVILQGDAMSADAKIQILVRVTANNFQLHDLTLQKSGWHLLQIVGEVGASYPIVSNVIFRDAYQQMLKVSIDQNNYNVTGNNGTVENSLFEYTAGIGPEYYIGGIDVHGGKNWVIRGNTFRSIASPNTDVAEFAIHFWNQSANPLIERNLIINCDRGIGFGLDSRGNTGGIVRNNMIYHANNSAPYADTGIYLDQSPGTQIYNNTVVLEHAYPRAIEYRYTTTSNVVLVNNLTNKPIASRDGATASLLAANLQNSQPSWFVNEAQGDLHLAAANAAVVDQGQAVAGLTDDFDGNPRPVGAGYDIGADEWGSKATTGTGSGVVTPNPPSNVTVQ